MFERGQGDGGGFHFSDAMNYRSHDGGWLCRFGRQDRNGSRNAVSQSNLLLQARAKFLGQTGKFAVVWIDASELLGIAEG